MDVLNGVAVVRTIATSSPSFSYMAAQQTTDFGSAQPLDQRRLLSALRHGGPGLSVSRDRLMCT
jgi:hypothetical protein